MRLPFRSRASRYAALLGTMLAPLGALGCCGSGTYAPQPAPTYAPAYGANPYYCPPNPCVPNPCVPNPCVPQATYVPPPATR